MQEERRERHVGGACVAVDPIADDRAAEAAWIGRVESELVRAARQGLERDAGPKLTLGVFDAEDVPAGLGGTSGDEVDNLARAEAPVAAHREPNEAVEAVETSGGAGTA